MLVKVGFHIVVWFVQNDRVARFELDNWRSKQGRSRDIPYKSSSELR